ncbi:hypothetical protein B0A49_05999 [Cryomyces minteri]|uniref:Uncharacterized protein n=1 Tax=Cryomyces minteri TaxID=331657 RepID=A0A4U0WRG3_9PEZI|nr:hypothetical protein B0A49_05999 [Cryomyces minteri]
MSDDEERVTKPFKFVTAGTFPSTAAASSEEHGAPSTLRYGRTWARAVMAHRTS